MKAGTMLLKAILVMIVFAGIPHLVAHLSGQTQVEPVTYYDYADDPNWESYTFQDSVAYEEDDYSYSTIEEVEQHPLIGYWYVTYEELEVGVTYEFRQESDVLKAYSIEIYDKDENKTADNTLAMTVKSFDNNQGVANYFIEYEGEKYEIESTLKLVGDKLEISYSYYGYDGTETWKKVTE